MPSFVLLNPNTTLIWITKQLNGEHNCLKVKQKSVADPGFPIGGAPTHWGGAPTTDAYTFWQKHMRKRKKWILLGEVRAGGAPPLGSANGNNNDQF